MLEISLNRPISLVFGLPSTSKSTPKSPVDSRKDRKDDNFIEKNDQKLAETSKLDFLTEQSSSFPKIPEIQVDGNKEIVKMVTIPQTISQQPPPPPPPPPPPMLPPLPKSSSTVSKGADGGRSSLMEAIRATGGLKGANLKKVFASNY
jgi:hypothetical protein